MKKWQWLLVAGALGAVVLTQIPRRDDTASGRADNANLAPAASAGLERVTLSVTGMT